MRALFPDMNLGAVENQGQPALPSSDDNHFAVGRLGQLLGSFDAPELEKAVGKVLIVSPTMLTLLKVTL